MKTTDIKRKTRLHEALLSRFQRLHADTELAWAKYKADRTDRNLDIYVIQLRRCNRIMQALESLPA